MGMMIAGIYEALIESGASEEKAKSAPSTVPAGDRLASKSDIREICSGSKLLKFAVFTLYAFYTCHHLQDSLLVLEDSVLLSPR